MRFDPKIQPGHESRGQSFDFLLGDGVAPSSKKESTMPNDERDLRKVFKSFLDPRMLPSLWNRIRK